MAYSYQDTLAYYGVGGAHPGGLSLTKQIFHNENITHTTKILDAGCGTGQTSAYLAEMYKCDVTALDIHPVMIEKAKKRFKERDLPINTIQSSVENIPVSDQTYDYIISESVTVFTNIEKTLTEYFRVLKKGGILINIDMTAEGPLHSSDITMISNVYGISYVLTENEWISLLREVGYRKVNVLHSDSLSSHINKSLEQPEFHISPSIDPKLMEILQNHQNVTSLLANKIGYRIFKSKR
ncbi:class I SAM-dependent methyltransferase [Heyndrickxia sporothermodurans]|uniref:Class I SAM-dependent methyltransferase n=1 Tax=Heyndrickxia sporothermodurans TaxID=46224 RepID=A0AB37HB96_9BACI|nr:class I SAM-dependent methyltransferase [Heyndrickxia sporothermodurans]MBL5771325.1 class I SAM-dependent methyltransferase [Heyndrickxia sporothermodurans]MBL5775040.1 class I SAM-dependent methyltransferase [Heyndrickxia sporothermodurans]MBL5796369.1 class I SAM-dependent methyltransferase [Heyndrickxia sporothermodurans]MBL5807332.1 class I SAM-dependent methyltransferase [Heyndrickxia sporothermodurans]MBL5812404.1 class I SAM-dependent methyltransferase [Heyndrickxia sporothermoduran